MAEALFHYISERYGDTWAGAQTVTALRVSRGPCPRSLPASQRRAGESDHLRQSVGNLAGIRTNESHGLGGEGAFWGSWFGLAEGVLANLEGDRLLTSTLLAGDAGFLATATMAPGWDMSRNRARLISIAGVLGGLVGAGLDLLIQPDNEKVAMGIPTPFPTMMPVEGRKGISFKPAFGVTLLDSRF